MTPQLGLHDSIVVMTLWSKKNVLRVVGSHNLAFAESTIKHKMERGKRMSHTSCKGMAAFFPLSP